MRISSSIENKIYFNKYKADSKIGQGSFGNIYSAHHIQNGEKYALKIEKKNGSHSLLETETYILCYLKGEGIPYIKSFGFSGEYNILVMELLGKSLELLFQENECKFSLKTVCMLADQMITRLEYIHKKYILHRDIKPDNFTLGRGKQSHIVYLIDFGLSKKYRSSKGNHEHIKYTENKKLIGTARYASINALKGCEQGRRDDLEALGYVLMYFLRGNLPWQGLKLNKGDDRYKKIYEKKKNTTPEELCVGYPKQFCEFIKYARSLSFEQEPNYNYLKKLIYNVMNKYDYSFDYLYDWGIKKKKSDLNKNISINKGIINNNISLDKKDNIAIKNNPGNNAIKKIDSERKMKSDSNNIKFSSFKGKNLNSDPRLDYNFQSKNSFKKKEVKKKEK
jgi:serine/threonine protein kinase